MQALPRAARWYLWSIWAAALLGLVYACTQVRSTPPMLLLLGVLITFVLADYFFVAFTIHSRQQIAMTVVDALTVFLVSVVGVVGIVVPVLGSLISDTARRRPWFKGLFNAAQRALSYLVLVSIYAALHQPGAPPFTGPRGLLAFLLIALVYHTLNTLFVSTIVALSSGQALRTIYSASYKQVHWIHFITLPFGALLAYIWSANPWLLLPAAVPLLMAQRSFQAMAEVQHQAQRNEELARQATALLEELRTKQNELVRSSQLAALGTFSAGIAHEFNNLLAAILGYAQLALTTDDPREKDEALDVAIAACMRGRGITSALLTFARQGDHQRELCQLDVIVSETITLMRQELGRHHVQVTQHLEPVPSISCDAGQIGQVLINLLTNARDAMAPHGGELLVTLRANDAMVELAVQDQGTGIAAELLPQIFQPFITTKGAMNSSSTPGTGLGLAISHGIVTAHGGSIDVESTLGVGTTFTVRLPLEPPAAAAPLEAQVHVPEAALVVS
jgi:signal transduction histidine kinase/xanthosine utilization system XapX-like protein